MKILTYTYRHTVYHRQATCGGMDSEPAGNSVERGTYVVAIPDDSLTSIAMANSALAYHGGNAHDKAFFIEGYVMSDLNAVIRSPLYRI